MKLSSLKIFLLIIVISASSSFQWAQSGPKAVIHPSEYDFGNIIQDSVVTTFYVITNEGSDLLKIAKVNASCGCTAVMPEKNELKPGESTKITATFNSKGRSGKQNKIITIETNDPQNPTIKLSLTGNVIKNDSQTETNKTRIKNN